MVNEIKGYEQLSKDTHSGSHVTGSYAVPLVKPSRYGEASPSGGLSVPLEYVSGSAASKNWETSSDLT